MHVSNDNILQMAKSENWIIAFSYLSSLGFCLLRTKTAHQQTHPGSLHGQPWAVYAPPQARHHWGAADEGSGSRGEEPEKDGEVQVLTLIHSSHVIQRVMPVEVHHAEIGVCVWSIGFIYFSLFLLDYSWGLKRRNEKLQKKKRRALKGKKKN